jgi:hypothetical protein
MVTVTRGLGDGSRYMPWMISTHIELNTRTQQLPKGMLGYTPIRLRRTTTSGLVECC